MNAHHSVFGRSLIAPVFLGALAMSCGTSQAMAEEAVNPAGIAQAILAESGIQGGLVVHLGCGDGKLTAALRADDRYLVHGLDRNPEAVAGAREHVRSLGLHGPVSIEQLHGARLPYTDNLVNLLVAEDPEAVSGEEIRRVLAPQGVAMVRQGDAWRKTVKPRPENIGRWTHYLHGPDNNAVTDDEAFGAPYHLQWVADPAWARSHEHLASISAVVCCGRRLYYIVDEGPTALVALEPDWQLVARDAFSGVLLW
ncbi:MAG: class I SAM-dependent methyltransferase, partial [Thermoguttaceae bacterium]|nr:class I SAM-dependent methyltransferase [Thermoguttaceae bacterium]